MSDGHPGPGATSDQFEIVGPAGRPRPSRSRRYVGVVAAAAVAGAAVGGGVWAWQAWTEQGAQPAQALPANTLAYAALDLDPPGEQKVAAFRTLRKFPSLERELGLDSTDEVATTVVEELDADYGCDPDLGQMKSWMGDRIAFAVVEQARPEPVVVVQVEDAARARAALDAAGGACNTNQFGYAIDGDWAVLAGSEEVATQVRTEAQRRSLDEDADFRSLTEAAGEPGLATLYAAPEAGRALLDAIDRDPWVGWTVTSIVNQALDPMTMMISAFTFSSIASQSFEDDSATGFEVGEPSAAVEPTPEMRKAQRRLFKRMEHFDELTKAEQDQLIREQDQLMEEMYGDAYSEGAFTEDEVTDEEPEGYDSADVIDGPEVDPALRESLQHFSGLGGVARFADDGLQVEIVGDVIEGTSHDAYAGSAGDAVVSDLPAGTAMAFGAGLADDWPATIITRWAGPFPFAGPEGDAVAAFEEATGLDVRADLEALDGDAFALVAGDGFSPDDAFDDSAQARLALRVNGDADRIEAVLDKLRTRLDTEQAAMLQSRRVGEYVVIGPNADYLDELAEGGDRLGDSDRYRDVVGDADEATSVLFVDFDAGDWLAESAASERDRKDAEPLDSLGMTVTRHGDEQKILLRVTFD